MLEDLAGRACPVLLPALAADVTGDTKALSHGTVLSTLVLRALAIKTGVGRPGTAGSAGTCGRRTMSWSTTWPAGCSC